MSHMKFITDQRPGEPDILSGYAHQPLVIRSLGEKRELVTVTSSEPWTHASLCAIGVGLDCMLKQEFSHEGADAYLADHWIGSTEV